MRIIFLGTPEFAVPSLEAILNAGYEVVAVVTAPDKPAGRGMKMSSSPIKQFAEQHHIPVLQPNNLKSQAFIEEIASYKADLQIVIAFRMLPEVIWNMPPLGTINLHASLLPDYRGAAPINWAIMNGEKVTGVCTFKLKHEIDTGDLIYSKEVPITEQMDAGELHDKLKEVGAEVILKTLNIIGKPSYTTIPQNKLSYKLAPKIFTKDCYIDWTKKAVDIHNQIRGLSPYPGAITTLNGKLTKVYKATYTNGSSDLKPGEIETDHKTFLKIRCADGNVNITEIQVEGKKRMFVTDFLRGTPINVTK